MQQEQNGRVDDSGVGQGLPKILSHLRARPRLFTSLGVAAGIYALLPANWLPQTRALAAFDTGTAIFLVLAWLMMWQADPERMRNRARIEDEGRFAVLALVATAAGASLLAIGFELHAARALSGTPAALRVGLSAGTILLAWLLVHTTFALHYAHEYYGPRKTARDNSGREGLVFPGEPQPDYWDFLYFSFVIGSTCQVSDVQVTSRALRRLVLAQGVLAFLFNTSVLALAINIAAGLI
jgi:uncharacterized membrane protein